MAAAAPDERDALLATLRHQREHALGILEGLDDDALRRPVLPSAWTCLGLVHHLAVDVERFWFRAVVAGAGVELLEGAEGWQVAPDVPADDVFALYRRECELADAVIAATPLDAAPAWWPADFFGDMPPRALSRTILHVIAETACHAGHLDVVRELIDGRSWLVMTE